MGRANPRYRRALRAAGAGFAHAWRKRCGRRCDRCVRGPLTDWVHTNSAGGRGGGITIANTGRVEATDVWVHTNSAGGRGGGIAVLSYAANTDPQLVMVGVMQTVEAACMYRGTIGFNQYCSDIKSNTANEGAGVYLEDGTELISRTAIRQNNAAGTASALWMRNVATGSPALSASNVLIVNNGNVANADSVRVGGARSSARRSRPRTTSARRSASPRVRRRACSSAASSGMPRTSSTTRPPRSVPRARCSARSPARPSA